MLKNPIPNKVTSQSLPAPTGGLNTRSPLSNMPIDSAIQMTNAVPSSLGVSIRKGYKLRKTGFTNIQSIMSYNGVKTTPDRLFVSDSGTIKDIDSVAPSATGFTSSIFRSVQMSTQGGQYLVVANGTDSPRMYNGSVWTTFTISATPSAVGQWNTSISLNDLKNPLVHQKRLWFTIKNSTKICYGPINSLGGDLVTFDVGGLFARGGIVQDICSWSSDGGSGLNNRLVIVSSEGDIVIFSGSDPSVAGSFSNDGIWQLSKPAPENCFISFAGDILYFSETGVFPLNSYLNNSTSTSAISLNISNTIGELVRTFSASHGFCSVFVPNENLLVINIPQSILEGSVQFVFSPETSGWAMFTGLPANSWVMHQGVPYFAGGQNVYEAFSGYSDAANTDGSGGHLYSAVIQQAFSNLGNVSRKHLRLVRPYIISTTTQVPLKISVKTDFDISSPENVPSISVGSAGLWDVSKFDQATFGSENVVLNSWLGTTSYGSFISVMLVLSSAYECLWSGTDIVYENGGLV